MKFSSLPRFLLATSLLFPFASFAAAEDVPSAQDIQSCLSGIELNYGFIRTNLPGVDANAIGFNCQEPSGAALSTDFTPEVVASGQAVRAPQSQVILYVTTQGLRFVEYPSYYYFVSYHDAAGTVDVGVYPSHVMPLDLSNNPGACIIQDGQKEGLVLQASELDAYAQNDFFLTNADKAKRKYLNPYKALLTRDHLPVPSLQEGSSLPGPQVRSCIVKQILPKMWARAQNGDQNLNNRTYSFMADQSAASAAFGRDQNAIQTLKAKYRMTGEEWTNLYLSRLNAIPGCAAIMTDAEKAQIVRQGLASVLSDYSRVKSYIDQL